ncbi:MAG: S-layer homology domain-containing protein [Patescibacteria group bacterium]
MRRVLLSLALSLVLCLILGQAALARFSDEPAPDEWYYEEFITVYNAGLIVGYPDGTFKGDRRATRYEVVAFLARLLNHFEERLAASPGGESLGEDRVKALIAEALAKKDPGMSGAALTSETDEIYQAIQVLEAALRKDLDALDVRVTTLEEEIPRLKAKNDEQDASLAKLQEELDAARRSLAQLEAAAAEAEDEAQKARTYAIIGAALAILAFLL